MLENPLVAKCGLNCAICSIYAAQRKGRHDWLARAAEHFKCRPDQVFCDGCGGDISRRWTDADCKIIACQRASGHDYCKDCAQFPCELALDKAPDNLRRIHEVGAEAFFAEDIGHNTCPTCGELAMRSDKACHGCGGGLERRNAQTSG